MRGPALLLAVLILTGGSTGAAASDDDIEALRARIAELEAQADADAETIARLRADRDARLSVTDGELLRARILNLTQSLATARNDRDGCEQVRRSTEAEARRAASTADDFRLRLRQAESQARSAENRVRTAESDARRARSEAQRLRSDLMRCR